MNPRLPHTPVGRWSQTEVAGTLSAIDVSSGFPANVLTIWSLVLITRTRRRLVSQKYNIPVDERKSEIGFIEEESALPLLFDGSY